VTRPSIVHNEPRYVVTNTGRAVFYE
jgi:hypothetical protein